MRLHPDPEDRDCSLQPLPPFWFWLGGCGRQERLESITVKGRSHQSFNIKGQVRSSGFVSHMGLCHRVFFVFSFFLSFFSQPFKNGKAILSSWLIQTQTRQGQFWFVGCDVQSSGLGHRLWGQTMGLGPSPLPLTSIETLGQVLSPLNPGLLTWRAGMI